MPRKCVGCESAVTSPKQRKFCSAPCRNRYHSLRSYHKNKKLNPRSHSHPNLKTNYFENIDSKEKAYWLGFLCADGGINIRETQLQVHLSIKDEDQINKFIKVVGANPDKKRYYGPYEHSGKSVMVFIIDKVFVSHLVGQGCTYDKTSTLRLPSFGNMKLDLAFLMGYFDGDGRESDCQISSSNWNMLEDIKNRYDIESKIRRSTTAYNLNLGAKLFHEMLENYPESMLRKRKTYFGGSLQGTLILDRRTIANDRPSIRKFNPTPEELETLVWEMPAYKVGNHFGVSGRAIKQRCQKYNIETPGRGYWAKKNAGKLS